MSWLCRIGLHRWSFYWVQIGKRSSAAIDGVWWKVYEKPCERGCGARQTLDGPLRYSASGDILTDEIGRWKAKPR